MYVRNRKGKGEMTKKKGIVNSGGLYNKVNDKEKEVTEDGDLTLEILLSLKIDNVSDDIGTIDRESQVNYKQSLTVKHIPENKDTI